MENNNNDYSQIKGWGVDADLNNDPTYPMRHRNENIPRGYSWDRPSLQPVNIEVLHSNERPNVSAVFGTSSPPSGLSGHIRRFAFKYSENSYLHWLPLLMADRVQVIEGIVDDLKSGYVPNIFAERGGKAIWKHNKKGIVKRVAVGLAIASAVAVVIYAKKAKAKRIGSI